MRKINFNLFILVLVLVSCQQKKDSPDQSALDHVQEPSDQRDNSGTGISFKIISGENGIPGYGYDIYMDGKLYIHQPTIPAVSGNFAFATEQKAIQAAHLVIYKIEHNILPPTIEVRELDSLHLIE